MRFRSIAAFAGLLMLSVPASAAPEPLSGEALSAAVSGATIHFRSPIGTTVPAVYGQDGQVRGRAGAVSWYLGSSSDTGRWWVTGNQLCHKWTIWFNAAVRCLTLRRDGRTIYWSSDDNDHGTAVIAEAPSPPAVAAGSTARPVPQVAKATPSEGLPRRPLIMAGSAPRPASVPIVPKSGFSENAFNPAASRGAGKAPAAAPQTPTAAASSPPAASAAAPAASAPSSRPAAPAAATSNSDPGPAGATRTAVQPRVETVPSASPPRPGPTAPVHPGESEPPQWSNSYRVAGVMLDDVLWVRKGPSSLHEPVGSISPRGRGVRVVGPCLGYWCPIAHRGMRGWVNRYYLAADLPRVGTRRAD